MYKLTVGELRFILERMTREIEAMEKAGVLKLQAVTTFHYFKTELVKGVDKFIENSWSAEAASCDYVPLLQDGVGKGG
jgi:hypothetical protein